MQGCGGRGPRDGQDVCQSRGPCLCAGRCAWARGSPGQLRADTTAVMVRGSGRPQQSDTGQESVFLRPQVSWAWCCALGVRQAAFTLCPQWGAGARECAPSSPCLTAKHTHQPPCPSPSPSTGHCPLRSCPLSQTVNPGHHRGQEGRWTGLFVFWLLPFHSCGRRGPFRGGSAPGSEDCCGENSSAQAPR